MKKFVIITGVAVALLIILGFVAKFFVTQHKKSFSPEEEVTYNSGEVEIKVFYNRPFKKDREIFGGLVPFDKVWRTGANEATTFQTNKDLLIEGKTLKSGKYSLWTIPGEETWKVIFNSEYGESGPTAKLIETLRRMFSQSKYVPFSRNVYLSNSPFPLKRWEKRLKWFLSGTKHW